MKISENQDVFSLIQAFHCSDGYLAVVDDNNRLVGLFGRKEFELFNRKELSSLNENHNIDDRTFFQNICDLMHKGYINTHFSKIICSDNLDNDVRLFFRNHPFAYVPVITSDGKFIKFAVNEANIPTDAARKLTRRVIAERWKIYDKFSYIYDDYDFLCAICNGTINTKSSKKKVTACIFGGGKLIRYACPHCGAIVGPLKMLKLTQEELDEDYRQHYSVFQEGDTTEYEINTFRMLEPQKDRCYLNYGCGGEWSRSIQVLREEGYDVWGYEPFAQSSGSEFIITDAEELKGHQYDGIFSNNLLEHLANPVEELKFMKSLLRDSDSNMAHSTPCYEYRYAYTRFHLCFLVGKSADIMFRNAGLAPYKHIETFLHENRYICICLKQS
ncbi:class I SAM-dependent methyltransferase [Lacrimispora sp.]|jgi:hypothetical protein|uniref:class I SAM-dependent methyltransferase n=1 Tax=Lacrimispora sp. TaxID=2719234 RepID=UPI0028988A7E|nr:class I SAM-dependent methyltransferase [Lacrimispora sp.]